MRSWIVAGVAALLVGLSPAAAQELKLVDLTGEFDRFATRTSGQDDKTRVAAFEREFATAASGFYARSRKPQGYDKRIAAHLSQYPEKRAKVLEVSSQFRANFEPARHSFEKAFGPVRSSQPVYILYSFGEMDGGMRELGGKNTLIFGADVIADIHAGTDMRPFFHHELFHVVHEPLMAGCDQIWCSMWEEGLATYVAASLNPQAGDRALMLDKPAPIRPSVDKDLAAAFRAAQPLLTSEKEDDYASLFFGNSHLPGYPARMGYYLGYLVARDMARTRSLKQLAALRGDALEAAFMKSFSALALGPAPGSEPKLH